MIAHEFIFHPGNWIGEGKVTFSISPEALHFYTKWTFENEFDNIIQSSQTVEIQDNDPSMRNNFKFSEISPTKFTVDLENDILGKVKGNGIIDAKNIAWEFHHVGGLEGFEIYELQENGEYIFHAEYTSPDQFRTIIDGRIWKKSV
jgi:hypothetical protein